jgi:hypothetical protein
MPSYTVIAIAGLCAVASTACAVLLISFRRQDGMIDTINNNGPYAFNGAIAATIAVSMLQFTLFILGIWKMNSASEAALAAAASRRQAGPFTGLR